MNMNLKDALLDVRRAYRLLAEYQRRQFELLSYIRDLLGATPYYQKHVFPRPDKLAGLENQVSSGLRYLPFMDISAIWLSHQGQEEYWNFHRAGDQMFGAWVRSDTGFDKYKLRYTPGTAEDSRSILVLSVVVCDQPSEESCNWYSKVWNYLPYPDDGTVGSDPDVPGYRVYSDSIDLAALGDQSAVNAAIELWCCKASSALDVAVGARGLDFKVDTGMA